MSGLVLLSAFAASCVAILGGLELMFGQPWNFPGDPPVFEFLLYAAGTATAVNAASWGAAYRWWKGDSRLAHNVARTALSVSAALFAVACLGIAERHGPRWAAVRQALSQYSEQIAAVAGDRERVLSYEEFSALGQRFIPRPVPVYLPGFGDVHLRMMSATYPYVGLDFGGGSNAMLDLATMLCTYSD